MSLIPLLFQAMSQQLTYHTDSLQITYVTHISIVSGNVSTADLLYRQSADGVTNTSIVVLGNVSAIDLPYRQSPDYVSEE